MTYPEFIAANRIKFSATRTDRNPHMDDGADMDHWRCVISRSGRRMVLTFSKGFGHNGAEPELAEVLECLASDAIMADELFESWCASLGYDPDSRKAERTYKACRKQAASLRRVLGPAYDVMAAGEVES